MQEFQHKLRTNLHLRNIEAIMNRNHNQIKSPINFIHRVSTIDNIGKYLRKYEINKENLNLAKRINECKSEHCMKRYQKQWKKNEQIAKVRSNFKKNPSINYSKFQPIQNNISKGYLSFYLKIHHITPSLELLNKKNIYYLNLRIGKYHVNLINYSRSLEQLQNSQIKFQVPQKLRKKKLTCFLSQISSNCFHNGCCFHVRMNQRNIQQCEIKSDCRKIVGIIKLEASLTNRFLITNNQLLHKTTLRNTQSQSTRYFSSRIDQ